MTEMSNEEEKRLLLLVDDDLTNIKVVNAILEDEYKIRVATNGAKAGCAKISRVNLTQARISSQSSGWLM